MEMNAQASELQAAENNLKQLMAEVTRAMEKAQEAIAEVVSKTARATFATAETSVTSSPTRSEFNGQHERAQRALA
jgi:predicted  nucleic acid-binding Zn-ribbon protein